MLGYLLTVKSDKNLGWVFFLISPAHLHVRPMGRTCRWANEIELAPIGVELNGWVG